MPLKYRRLLLLLGASYAICRLGFLRAPWGFEAACEQMAADAAKLVAANQEGA